MLFMSFVQAAEPELRGYDEFDIPEGTHIPVISLQEFSTAYCEEGDKVSFKTVTDIYMYDKNVIPEGTTLTGYIDKKNEVVVGLQTDKPLKRIVNLYGGTRMADKALEAYNKKLNPTLEKYFKEFRKTHNDGVKKQQ